MLRVELCIRKLAQAELKIRSKRKIVRANSQRSLTTESSSYKTCQCSAKTNRSAVVVTTFWLTSTSTIKPKTMPEEGKNNREFLEEWLEKIQTINGKDEAALANTLALLFNFVNRYDGHQADSQDFDKLDAEIEIENQDLPRDRRRKIIIKVNREMTIGLSGAVRKKIAERLGYIPAEVLILYL